MQNMTSDGKEGGVGRSSKTPQLDLIARTFNKKRQVLVCECDSERALHERKLVANARKHVVKSTHKQKILLGVKSV